MSKYEQMISGIRSEYGARFLMDFIPAGFFRCSMDTVRRVDMANRTMLDLFGCRDTVEFEDLTGEMLGGMIPNKDYGHAIMESWNQLYQGKDILKTEFRVVRKDKSTRWVDCRGRIIEGEKGQRWVYTIMLDGTEDKKQVHTYKEKSRRDSPTGLLNREASKEQITQYLEAVGTEGTAALMIIDIDNFKDISDTEGHLFRDSVLTEVAKCISGVSRRGDVVSRIGGDEFLVFLIEVNGQEEVMAYGGRIMEGLVGISAPAAESFRLKCCIGVAMYPEHATEFDQFFARADIALYSGKRSGKGKYVFYQSSLPSVDAARWESFSARVSKIDSEDERICSGDRIIHYVFKALYESEDIKEAIDSILEIVGVQFNVSRVYIFEDSPDRWLMSNTFEWYNRGVSPQIDSLQNMSYETDAPGYRDNFDESGVFLCVNVDVLPPVQKGVLTSQDIKAILQCGIYDNGRLIGFTGFDECKENRQQTGAQVEALAYVARVVGTFLFKNRVQNVLKQELSSLQNVLDGVTEQINCRGQGGGTLTALPTCLSPGRLNGGWRSI